jgi:hypothetical protein
VVANFQLLKDELHPEPTNSQVETIVSAVMHTLF